MPKGRCKLCGAIEDVELLEDFPPGVCINCAYDTPIPDHIPEEQEDKYFTELVKKRGKKVKITKRLVEEYIVVKQEIEEKKLRMGQLEDIFLNSIEPEQFFLVNGYKIVHKVSKGRKSPSWKKIVEDKLGEKFVKQTIKDTPEGKATSKILVEPYIKP